MQQNDQREALARELTAAGTAAAGRDVLRERLAVAEQQFVAACLATTETARLLPRQSTDTATLESLSLTRLLASLRGSRATQLDSERAQQKRAQYSHAVAVATRDAAATNRTRLRQALNGLTGVDQRQAAARAAAQSWLQAAADTELARHQIETAELRGELAARALRTQQALVSGRQALSVMAQARRELSSVDDWATIDVFAGGGVLADSARRNQMDRAGRQLHAAESAVRRFSSELAETGGTAEFQVDLTMTVLNAVFDDVFSDQVVRNRRADSSNQAHRAHQLVTTKVSELSDTLLTLQAEQDLLTERQTRTTGPLTR